MMSLIQENCPDSQEQSPQNSQLNSLAAHDKKLHRADEQSFSGALTTMHPVNMKYSLFFFALMLCACAAPVVQTDTPHVAAAYISPQEHYFEAVRRGDITMVMRLVEEGLMNIGHKDVYGWTGLMYAVQHGHEGMVDYFILRQADINATDANGLTPLMIAAKERHPEIVGLLLEAGAKAEVRDTYGFTALMWAIYDKSYDSAQLLLARKNTLNIKNKFGQTALHLAVDYRMEDIAVELIRSGAAVNITDLDGNTPLHLAARSSPDRVIRLLIKKGASPYLKNNEGKTALDIAREAHQQGNVDCLKKSKPKK